MLAKKSAEEEWDYGYSPSSLSSSEVEYTFTFDCCLSNLSSDHMPQSSFNANAKKSESSGSGDIFLPSGKNLIYSFSLENLTATLSNFSIKLYCVSDKENLLRISDLCSLISFRENNGECSSKFGRNDN